MLQSKVQVIFQIPTDIWREAEKEITLWAIENDLNPQRSRTKWLIDLIEEKLEKIQEERDRARWGKREEEEDQSCD